jgi:AraC family transcriptional regulator, carnitine catabolism transcriptional activator
MAPKNDIPGCRDLGLLLVDGFALMSYASIVEPFRAANDLAKVALYRWTHISTDGRKVSASNGASVLADRAVGDPLKCDTLFVFGRRSLDLQRSKNVQLASPIGA